MNRCVVLNWNVEWASPRSKRFEHVRHAIESVRADIIVLTEGSPPVLPPDGHVVTSEADYGYAPADRSRRKVLLWSRRPWCDVDITGPSLMPGGRFVAATTETEIGRLQIVGVCIPWRDAHVRTGRKDRRPWEDHVTYLDGLSAYLASVSENLSTLVVGDFNQRIPPEKSPTHVSQKLEGCFTGWKIVTAALRSMEGDLLIDHVAICPEGAPAEVSVLNRKSADGATLSDHYGVVVSLS